MIAAITANRNLSPRDRATIRAAMGALCEMRPEAIILGGARGGDTEALVAADLYRDPDATRLVVVVPRRLADQPREAREAVDGCLVGAADELVELGLPITAADGWAAFKRRNEAMVDRATHVLGFWNGDRRSGTWSCLAYAMRTGRPTWWEAIGGSDR